MSWPQVFRDELAKSRIAPVWQLRTVSQYFTGRTAAAISSHPGLSGIAAIAEDGVSVFGEAVDPKTWNTTHGGFTINLAGPAGANVWVNFRRGTVVQLFMGFAGWQESDFQPIALGVIERISPTSANSWKMQCQGIGQLLASRLDRTTEHSSLFYNLPQETTLAADFAAADTSAVLTDASGFERETGGSFLLLVTPTTGDPFYVLGTGRSSNTITGITTLVAALDTTRVDAVAGDVVESVAYIAGNPCDIARKVLLSTGTGSNGAFDTLPESWGLGLPDTLFDHADTAWFRNVALEPSTGGWNMVATSTGPQENPESWLASYLAPVGVWITMRQGQLTIRCAQTPELAKVRTTIDIGGWIEEDLIQSHDFEDTRYPVEYTVYQIHCSSATPGTTEVKEDAECWPAGGLYEQTMAVYGGAAASQYMRASTSIRVSRWITRTPENMRLTATGWWLSQLCPGDIVGLTTDLRQGRPSGSALHRGRFVNRQVMLLAASPAILPGAAYSTELELSILPETNG